MSDDFTEVSLSDQHDPTSPAYIQARLMELEQEFYEMPDRMQSARDALVVAEEVYRRAKARAFLDAKGSNKEAREAESFIATIDERERVQVAEAAFKYLVDVSNGLRSEKDALQTRSANLRSEAELAGKGRP